MSTEQTGAELIAAERQRQIEVEGWTAEHDDEHEFHELAWAAVCYAAPDLVYSTRHGLLGDSLSFIDPWPRTWRSSFDKRPRNFHNALLAADETEYVERIRCLAKAGALIAAEIDRLQRRMQAAAEDGADDGLSTRHYPSVEDGTEGRGGGAA